MDIELRPGSEPVAGYTLVNRLGRGGFGEVWKATGPGGFHVALKFVSLDETVGPAELRALEVIKDIRHPHLLGTFGSWQVGGRLIIAMELADRTLLDRLREAAGQGFPGIPAPEVFEHFLDASKALDYLNEPRHPAGGSGPQGIQHRDVKPQNLLLVGGSVKVADFGLARVLEHSQTGHTGSMTVSYAAPEFFDKKTSSQSDQYSLAVTYCQLRGGRLPFEGVPAAVIHGHLMREPDLSMIPEVEREAVARALAKSPRGRWSSCRAFVQAVIEASREVQAPPTVAPTRMAGGMTTERDPRTPSPAPKPGPFPERPSALPSGPSTAPSRRWPLYLAGAVSLVAIGLLLWAMGVFRSGKPADRPTDLAAKPPDVGIAKAAVAKEAIVKPPARAVDEFRPLFNGKDLAGWKTHPKQPGDWRVEDGRIIGRDAVSHLFSERGDFEDFHLRVEARINATGGSGVYFRSEFGLPRLQGRYPDGYEAQIYLGNQSDAQRTGSLFGIVGVQDQLVTPDTWFTLEVIAEGNHIIIRVGGDKVVDFTDEARRYSKGHFALQNNIPSTVVEFRKIEVKELRASTPTPGNIPAGSKHSRNDNTSRGLDLIASGDGEGAIRAFDEAIRLVPAEPLAYAGRGFSYANRGYRARAIADANEAIRLDPDLPLGYAARGYASAQDRDADFARAVADCDRAIRLDPEGPFGHASRGYVVSRRGVVKGRVEDQGESLADCDEAIRHAPRFVPAYLFRSIARKNRAEYDRAIADLDQALRLNPECAQAYALRALVWNSEGQHDLAIAASDRAILLDPKSFEAFGARSTAYLSKGDRGRAQADREEAGRLLAERER